MSATAEAPTATIDTSQTAKAPFFRLVSAEFRKMLNTRSGFWLLAITFGMLALVMGVILLVVALVDNASLTASLVSEGMILPLSLLVPVLAIMTVTTEWSQRTHLVTFTLEPHRGRVVAAKLAVVALLGVATIIAAVGFGSLTNVLYGVITGNEVIWDLDVETLAWTAGQQALWFLMAFGLAMLLLNTPGAVAIFYFFGLLAPMMVYSPLYAIFETARNIIPWIDLTYASMPFIGGNGGMLMATEVGATEWAQLASAVGIWVVAPIVFGTWRVMRSEAK